MTSRGGGKALGTYASQPSGILTRRPGAVSKKELASMLMGLQILLDNYNFLVEMILLT
jgi:hypothetical protein